MTPPGTFERVYAAIKQRLREGLYRPGDRLEPSMLSDELDASITPVRDALHRLTGERLVEAPRQGFRVPMITETTLRHLYAWHRDLLILAVVNRWTEPPEWRGRVDLDRATPDEKRMSPFLILAQMTGNPEHVQALEAITDKLQPVRLLESALLDAADEETQQIAAALRTGDRRQLRRSLVRYHRRRERIVPELLERLYGR